MRLCDIPDNALLTLGRPLKVSAVIFTGAPLGADITFKKATGARVIFKIKCVCTVERAVQQRAAPSVAPRARMRGKDAR